MAVTVVETVGAVNANSYVSVAEAGTYLEARLNSAIWTTALASDADAQKKAVIEATRTLNTLGWKGAKTSSTQALNWPRIQVEDTDSLNVYIENNVIPQRIKDATCELALEFLRLGTTDLVARSRDADVASKSVGGAIDKQFVDPSQRAKGVARFPRVQELVTPFLMVGFGQVRITR